MGENSYIYDKIKPPTMGRRILRENIENTSVKEFLSFMQKVRDERLFQGAQWGISDGHATSYQPVGYFIESLIKQIRSSEDSDSPITNYWVWKIGDPWTKKIDGEGKETRLSSEIDKALEDGLDGVLELGRDNKDVDFGKIGTNFTSKNKEEFAKAMSKGEFGSLDEAGETSGVSLAALGKELADEMKDELEKKKDELNEIDVVSGVETILSTVLASTTLINIISKYVGKFFKKYNIEKGAKGAQKIYDFTHKLENDFKSPIKRIVGLFTKNEKTKRIVTDSLYALLILTLGVRAGGGAIQSMDKGNLASGSVSSLKAALKGKDLATLLKQIAKAAV